MLEALWEALGCEKHYIKTGYYYYYYYKIQQISFLLSWANLECVTQRCFFMFGKTFLLQTKSPFKGMKVGQELKAKVIGYLQVKDHHYLPITHTHGVKMAVDLTLIQRYSAFFCIHLFLICGVGCHGRVIWGVGLWVLSFIECGLDSWLGQFRQLCPWARLPWCHFHKVLVLCVLFSQD